MTPTRAEASIKEVGALIKGAVALIKEVEASIKEAEASTKGVEDSVKEVGASIKEAEASTKGVEDSVKEAGATRMVVRVSHLKALGVMQVAQMMGIIRALGVKWATLEGITLGVTLEVTQEIIIPLGVDLEEEASIKEEVVVVEIPQVLLEDGVEEDGAMRLNKRPMRAEVGETKVGAMTIRFRSDRPSSLPPLSTPA
jgi:hypothetical protein